MSNVPGLSPRPLRPGHARAVGAAEEPAVGLDAVADHLHPAVLADRGERVDGALEDVTGVRISPRHTDVERLKVDGAASIACSVKWSSGSSSTFSS